MKNKSIGIIGGGLSGLVAAIHLSKQNLPVTLFEKESYPNHKVCGEYLSLEIIPYLEQLGINLSNLEPAVIDKLEYSTASGKTVNTNLPLGGLGISRFELDNFLYKNAISCGVEVVPELVTDVFYKNNSFTVITNKKVKSPFDIVLGAFGKRSLIDKKLERDFIDHRSGWLAIKAHYQMNKFPDDLVMLHNFKGGYCGLSKTESGAINVCYLASYNSFKKHKDPDSFKQNVLMQNPQLKSFFEKAVPLFEKDISIAQISFENKSSVHDHILMLGDAAGLIHPLSGNGMAMAIHSAKIASEAILNHIENTDFSRDAMEREYQKNWKKHFNSRLRMGRILQRILLSEKLSGFVQRIIHTFPSVLPKIISKTHGKPIL